MLLSDSSKIMAAEIEEPISLHFQAADSIHSGSISFGRFESEALCWERRSSFSHNRYLEEVQKFSKPGSVIEKKAYFEAHFRKKGILSLLLPESKNKTHYDDETSNIVIESHIVDNTGFIPEHTEIEEATNMTNGLLFKNHETEENSDDASLKGKCVLSPKEKIFLESEVMKTKLAPRVSVEQSKRYISSIASKVLGNKAVNNVMMKSRSEKKTSEASVKEKIPLHRTPKSEPGSKDKEVSEIKRVGEKSRNRMNTEPQSSTSRKVSSRVHQCTNRVKQSSGTTVQCTKQENSRLSSRNHHMHAGRRKELEEKVHAEAKVHQPKMKTQAIASNVKPGKLRTKCSSNAIINSELRSRVYPHEVTSSTSTVTSESRPSETGSNIYPSQPRNSILVSGKKEKAKERVMILNKHKAPESNKGKRMV